MLKQNLPQIYAKGGGASALHFRRLTCYCGRSDGTLHLQVVRQQGQTLKLAQHRQKKPLGNWHSLGASVCLCITFSQAHYNMSWKNVSKSWCSEGKNWGDFSPEKSKIWGVTTTPLMCRVPKQGKNWVEPQSPKGLTLRPQRRKIVSGVAKFDSGVAKKQGLCKKS